MTISFVTTRDDATYGAGAPLGQRTPKPPPRIWNAKDPPFKGVDPSVSDGYQQSSEITAIVIDNGQIVLVTFSHICNIANLYGLIQAPVSLERAGRLIKLRVSPSFQT